MNYSKTIILILFSALSIFPFSPAFPSDTQYQLNLKADKEFARADAELNRVYKQVLKDYAKDKNFLSKLAKAQLAWIKFRDAHIESLYPEKDKTLNYGSMYPSCYSTVITEITVERTRQLKKWLTGVEEGDVCAGSVKIKP